MILKTSIGGGILSWVFPRPILYTCKISNIQEGDRKQQKLIAKNEQII